MAKGPGDEDIIKVKAVYYVVIIVAQDFDPTRV